MSAEERALKLASRFSERLWHSPFADFLGMLPGPAADQIATELVTGLLKDVQDVDD